MDYCELNHKSYLEKVVQRFHLEAAKPVSNPLAHQFKLSKHQSPKTETELSNMAKIPYSNVEGCLMYGMTCTCPNIIHVISFVSKYMSCSGRHPKGLKVCQRNYLTLD